MIDMNEIKVFTERTQYVKIEIGDEYFGLDISIIDNIVRMQRITRVPNVAPYIKGVINLRGEIVPIMNLRMKMGLPEIEHNKLTRIIIIKTEAYGKIGLIVDAVREVIALEDEQIEKMKYDKNSDDEHFVVGIGKLDDILISLLDVNVVLNEKQKREDA